MHETITLTNDFNTSKSGLATQILKKDSQNFSHRFFKKNHDS